MASKQHLRIYICGPHSTGKTTLLHDLQPHLNRVKVIEEVARGIIREHGWQRDEYLPDVHPETFLQLNREILEKQIQVDFACSDEDYISDRGIDPIVYVSYYLDQEARETMYKVENIQQWLDRMRHSLVLLISPHKEIIQDDSVRLDSDFDELQGFYRLFQHELTVNEIPFENITILDRKERVNQVVSALEQHRKKIQAQNVSVENETCK